MEKFFSFRPDWHQDECAKPIVRQYQRVLDGLLRSHPKLARGVTCCAHCGIRFLTHPCNANRRDLRCPFGCRRHYHRELGNRRSAKYSKTSKGRKQKKLHNQRRSRWFGGSDGDPRLDARALREQFPAGRDISAEVSSHPEPPSPGGSRDESVSSQAAEEANLGPPPEATFRVQPQMPESPVAVATRAPVVASCVTSQEVHALLGHLATESRRTAGSVEDEPPLTLPLEGLSLDEASMARSPMLGYLRMVASLIEGRSVDRKELVEALRRSMRQRSLAQRSRTRYVLHFLHQHPP